MGHDAWLSRAPRTPIECGDLLIRRYEPDDAAEIVRVVSANIDHLRPHMAWIGFEPQSIEQRRALIVEWQEEWNSKKDFTMGIFRNGNLVGGTGFHVRSGEGILEIGYWVSADEAGSGVATAVSRALTDEAFSIDGVREVLVIHDAANFSSARVPEKLGYERMGGFPRESHPVVGGMDRAPGDTDTVVEWRVTRESWLAR